MNIAILGYGVVGHGVELLAEKIGFNVSYILMKDQTAVTKPNMTSDYSRIIADKNVDTVVECIGGDEPAHSFVKKALSAGKNVVTSNKKMLVKHFKELTDDAKNNNVNLLFSAACGGGIPWIPELSQIAETEEIFSYRGIMNGTSNYILDKMYREDLSFEEALRQAQNLGYAESDPSDDIDGIDTANKVVLSAGVAFGKSFALENVFRYGIRNISPKDLDFAKARNMKCVLLGRGTRRNNRFSLSVLPTFVKKESTFGNINDNYNCFILNSENLDKLSFIGQGAGSLPTASNVIRDIQRLSGPYHVTLDGQGLCDFKNDISNFYIRAKGDINNSVIEERISSDSFITKKISIEELGKICSEILFLGEVDND